MCHRSAKRSSEVAVVRRVRGSDAQDPRIPHQRLAADAKIVTCRGDHDAVSRSRAIKSILENWKPASAWSQLDGDAQDVGAVIDCLNNGLSESNYCGASLAGSVNMERRVHDQATAWTNPIRLG
jgi:hypothetical protein